MRITLIAACNLSNVIGNNGNIPWHLPADLKRFKALTEGHRVVMGRKTFESLGKPLSNRENIVMTRDRNWSAEGVSVVHDPIELIGLLNRSPTHKTDDLFVIGGAEIYDAFLPHADVIELTVVLNHAVGDTFFPKVNLADWQLIHTETHTQEKTPALEYLKYRYQTFRRINYYSEPF